MKKCVIRNNETMDYAGTEAMNTIAEKCGDEALADMMDYAADIFSEAF